MKHLGTQANEGTAVFNMWPLQMLGLSQWSFQYTKVEKSKSRWVL